MEKSKFKPNGFALVPFLIFVVVYLGIGVTLVAKGDPMGFYGFKGPVAVIVGIIAAFLMHKGSIDEKFDALVKGCGDANIITMCIIYILAGAFSVVSKQMGGVDSTVNLGLTLIPPNFVTAGLFIICCFLSIATGTSVGTIVAIVPIATGISYSTGIGLPLITATVVGGAFFGDNLSFISDTTVAATSSQGCKMRDKFRVNSFIVIPAALIILLIYIYLGYGMQLPATLPSIDYIKVLPYFIVLISAICGMNVMGVLTLGILSTGIVGIAGHEYDFYGWLKAMGDGILSMGELIIITMLAGGLLEIIRENGGIDYIIQKMTSHVKSKRGAELSIGILVTLVDICTANNTVAIITVGGISKQICDRFGVDNRKAASILDTCSCCMQGIIPYGAQMLIAAGLSKVNPIEILPYLYYPFAIGIAIVMSIVFRYPKRYS